MSELFLTHAGDLLIDDETRDIKVVDRLDEAIQSIGFRLKTSVGDLIDMASIGNNIEFMSGELLTDYTLRTAEDALRTAVMDQNIVLQDYIVEIRGFAVNASQALFVVDVSDHDERHALFTVPFDFQRGFLKVIEPDAIGNATLDERFAV
jgi:hypothetical protein